MKGLTHHRIEAWHTVRVCKLHHLIHVHVMIRETFHACILQLVILACSKTVILLQWLIFFIIETLRLSMFIMFRRRGFSL